MFIPLHTLRSHILITCCLLFIGGCGVAIRSTDDQGGPKDLKEVEKGEAFQQGVASWYGPKFHGKFTANGERYDMESMTAAHRSLPFNSRVRVVNLLNGKSVIVRVNDRGPFVNNRIIDLSKKAARKLNMIGPGTAPVHLYLLDKGNKVKNDNLPSRHPRYTIQLGAFEKRANACKKKQKIKGGRLEKVHIQQTTVYRIYYGEFDNWKSAAKRLKRLKRKGYHGFVKQLNAKEEA